MSTDTRLNGLYPTLTARERALHVLQAMKGVVAEDHRVRQTMPDAQVATFNRYVDLMNAANQRLGPFLLLLVGHAEKMGVQLGWLSTLHLWSLRTNQIAMHLWSWSKEPVTESDHATLLRNRRAEMVPASELAELLVERFEGWAPGDLEPRGADDAEPVVTEAAWAHMLAEKRRQLTDLIRQGVMTGTGKGARLSINVGTFYDWLGEPPPVHPDWGSVFEAFPDEEANRVLAIKEQRRDLLDTLRSAPSLPVHGSLGYASEGTGDLESVPDKIARALTNQLVRGVPECWRHLRAVQTILAEIGDEFEEDPLLPELRGAVDDVTSRLIDLHERAQIYTGPFDLPEADDALIQDLRDWLDLPVTMGPQTVTIRLP